MKDQVYASLEAFYGQGGEHMRLMSKHGSVEFLTTLRYIDKHLRPGMRVLEIGAGTGRYTHHLARMGYRVDAVELMKCNIDILRETTELDEEVCAYEGSATDLSFLQDETYDITLLLGPMYHLFTEEDKLRALSEALRVTKTGGVVFAAYCCADASILQHGFMKGITKQLIDTGLLDGETFKTHSDPKDVFELHTKQEIDGLMQNFHVTRLHYVGTDMSAQFMRELIDSMDDETFGLYMKYHFTVCERPDLVGASNHSLDIFRKE